ncbi:MAG: DUF4132 domain-containing protein [Planctomycetota bacterium]
MSEDAARELAAELARLGERPDELAEEQSAPLPRGAQPALFRALRAVSPAERLAALPALAPRLADLPLLGPILELVTELGLEEALVAALPAPDAREAWVAPRQVAALASAGSPSWALAACAALLAAGDEQPAPLDGALAWAAFPAERSGEIAPALLEVVRLRLSSSARRRDRPSGRLARGAVAALAALGRVEEVRAAALLALAVASRRAGSGEPELAKAALEALALLPPLERLRLLEPRVGGLAHRTVKARAEELLAEAEASLGLSPAERLDLAARDGGAGPDGWVEVDLEEGGVVRARIDARGELARDTQTRLGSVDERALQSAERALRAAWDELGERLERALVSERRWAPGLWRELALGEHPLWRDLARRVLWEQEAPGEPLRFTLDEAGQARDLFGEPLALLEQGAIGLAHPVRLDPEELELFREASLAHPLRAPFPQLFRRVRAPGDDPLARFVGREVYRAALDGFARRGGWSGTPLVGVGPWELWRDDPAAGCGARLELAPIEIEFKATDAQRKAAHRRARDGEKAVVAGHREENPRARIAAVALEGEPSPVTLAELVRELEELSDGLAAPDELYLRAWQATKWKDPQTAWREAVLRYRAGSPAAVEVRRALLAAFARQRGLELRLEDRFAITQAVVVELGTGLCHEGPPKDHLPLWKVQERLAAAPPLDLAWPFRPSADPETVEVVERVLQLALLEA